MKLQLPATGAVPAVLAAASIFLALLLVPGGGTSPRSASVAPALKFVAGDVAAVVESPVRAVTKAHPNVTRAHPKPAASPARGAAVKTASTQPASARSVTRHTPAHLAARHHVRLARKPVTETPVVTTPAVPTTPHVIPQTARHSPHGKAKAVGHLQKVKGPKHAPKIAPPQSNPPTAVPQGPPAVPPGHVKNGKTSDGHGASTGRGGGK